MHETYLHTRTLAIMCTWVCITVHQRKLDSKPKLKKTQGLTINSKQQI